MRGPEFPELRDKFIKEQGLEEKAKEGLDTLTAREVGTLGGLTNKAMVERAKEHLAEQYK